MNQTAKRILFTFMATLILLTACAPAPVAPTQDPELVKQLIEQSVALTVAAQSQLTAEAIPPATETPLPPTETAVPPTPIPVIPSATAFALVPPTASVSGGGGGTTVKPEYACDIIRQRPFDDTKYRPGEDFDVNWTIVNTGTKTWRAGLDLKYSTGPKMIPTDIIELPEMKPGDQFAIVRDAVAPQELGQQIMVWSLEGVNCYPYVRIIVDN